MSGRRPILITGASGFIGAHLARRIASTGRKVVGTCTAPHTAWRLRDLPSNFVLEVIDLRNTASMQALFAEHRFGEVFHLAAHGVQTSGGPTVKDASETTSVNTLGSLALGQAALRHGVDRFTHCGSGFEYRWQDGPVNESAPLGAPNLYGASKAAGWCLLEGLRRSEGLPLTTVRPFAVFGPVESDQKLIPYVIARALRRETLRLSTGDQIRDFVYVADVVDALLLAATSESAVGRVFNIGSGPAEARTIRQLVETALEMVGAPMSLCQFGEARRLRADPPCLVSDSTCAVAQLGWRPRVSLQEGLSRTIRSIASAASKSVAAA